MTLLSHPEINNRTKISSYVYMWYTYAAKSGKLSYIIKKASAKTTKK